MGRSIRDYLRSMETGSLQLILEYCKREENLEEYELSRKIVEEILAERENGQ